MGRLAMTAKQKTTIGKRIISLVALSVFLSILAISTILIVVQTKRELDSLRANLSATGMVYASALADHVIANDRESAQNVLRSISRVPGVLYANVAGRNGGSIAAMGQATFLQSDLVAENRGLLPLLTKGHFPVSVAIVRGGEKIGSLMLIADITPLRQNLLLMVLLTGLAACSATLLGVAVALPLRRRISAPIVSLTEAMTHVREKRDYTTKVNQTGDDETGTMVETFNAMLSEINFRDNAMERLAYFDPLTGLPNRLYFQKMLDEYLQTSKDAKAVLFLVDVDGFNHINDAFGHTIGDALLMTIAALLKEEAPANAIMGRLNGDEFAIVIPGVESQFDAQARFAPFVATLLKPVQILTHEIHVSISTGGVLSPRDGQTSGQLLRHADMAMHSAKRESVNSLHFFQPAMDDAVQEQARLAHGLRLALDTNGFETHFQPQADLRTGKIYGFESLIRWKGADGKYIPPSLFIPIAENAGLIHAIGAWILRDSCEQMRQWLNASEAPREISVNVSAAQMLQADFLEDVQSVLYDTGLPPHLLCLELTESLFIGKSIGRVRQMLDSLKGLGVKLALDDFGTGYSSLSYLERLPFDKVKVDRAFVSGIENDATKRSFLRGIISLAHTLGMTVVAEGAESMAEVDILKELGSDAVQGYALARPMPAKDALAVALRYEEQQADVDRPRGARVTSVIRSA